MIDNILGNKVLIRILRFMYLSPNRYFSFLEIEKYVGAGREGIKLALRKLGYYGLAYVEKKGGNRYKLKLDNPLVEKLKSLFDHEKIFFQGIDPKILNIISNFENDCIKKLEGLKGIWLFGSVAKGKAKEKSDIDLFVLVKQGKNKPLIKAALEEIKEKYEDKYAIQTIVMDEEEFKKRKNEPLIQEIEKSGINIVPVD
ncbi:nucleotidyltransferase domain-containing protein [Candidatus Woesearchaeota archaeon]|nr:nucleotidyltransferase domain-containing protein [Candidatus Woesearchaeota archaeon]